MGKKKPKRRRKKKNKQKNIGGNFDKTPVHILAGAALVALPNIIGIVALLCLIGSAIVLGLTENNWWWFLLGPSIIVVAIVGLYDCGVFTVFRQKRTSSKIGDDTTFKPPGLDLSKLDEKTVIWTGGAFFVIAQISGVIGIICIIVSSLIIAATGNNWWWFLLAPSIIIVIIVGVIDCGLLGLFGVFDDLPDISSGRRGGLFGRRGLIMGPIMEGPNKEKKRLFDTKIWFWILTVLILFSFAGVITSAFLLIFEVAPAVLWWILFGVSIGIICIIQVIFPAIHVLNKDIFGGGEEDEESLIQGEITGDHKKKAVHFGWIIISGLFEAAGIVGGSLAIYYTGSLWWLFLLIPSGLFFLCTIGSLIRFCF